MILLTDVLSKGFIVSVFFRRGNLSGVNAHRRLANDLLWLAAIPVVVSRRSSQNANERFGQLCLYEHKGVVTEWPVLLGTGS